MQFSTVKESGGGVPITECTAVNAATNEISYPLSLANGIYTVYFSRVFLGGSYVYPPAELAESMIYYLRQNVLAKGKVYGSDTDAQSETNPIDFATNQSGYLFHIIFPISKYSFLNGWAPAAETIGEIPCCPDVPAVFKDCPSLGVINYAGANRNLVRYVAFNNFDYAYGSLNSLPFQTSFLNVYPNEVQTFNVQINHYFNSWQGPYYPMNKPGLIIWFTGPNSTGRGRLFYEADELTLPTTTFTLMDIVDSLILGNQSTMTDAGLIPSTISITYSGQTNPPPQIRVSLPDAHFENWTFTVANGYEFKHINLGFIDEILTFDQSTLTYWSDLKTYAGVPGRIHFSLPNFYPLISSGANYISSDNTTGELLAIGGYANSEFNWYKTLDFLNVFDSNHPTTPADTFIRIFAASDEYGCYPTGLTLGTIWIDSRVIWNIAPTEQWPEDFSKRKAARISLAFSRWGSARFRRTNEAFTEQQGGVLNFNHYHQNFFMVKSVHPEAFITSLGL